MTFLNIRILTHFQRLSCTISSIIWRPHITFSRLKRHTTTYLDYILRLNTARTLLCHIENWITLAHSASSWAFSFCFFRADHGFGLQSSGMESCAFSWVHLKSMETQLHEHISFLGEAFEHFLRRIKHYVYKSGGLGEGIISGGSWVTRSTSRVKNEARATSHTEDQALRSWDHIWTQLIGRKYESLGQHSV